jgi:hypothetical protein
METTMTRPYWLAVLLVGVCTSTSHGVLTHLYTFNDGTANDTGLVGGAHGTLINGAAVAAGNLQLSAPNFSGPGTIFPHLSLPPSILSTTGNMTIEQWFNFRPSGFFTEAWAFSDNANDTNPPDADSGQYLMHTISNPQGGPVPSGGGSSVAQSLAGFNGGAESRAYGTTPGIGAGGGGYLDNSQNYMAATVIDGTAGTLSYYVFRVSDGVGGLQSSIPAIPLSSYTFTNAWLGRSPYPADNVTSGTVDEFRVYDEVRSTSQILADFMAGPTGGGPRLRVNRDTGVITLTNTGTALNIFGYTINAPTGALDSTKSLPISMRLDAASNGGNGTFDGNDAWDVVMNTANQLSEVDRLGEGAEDGGTLGTVTLSANNAWIKSFRQDLTASVQIFDGVNFTTFNLPVEFTGNGGAAFKRSDLTFDNLLTAADWNTFKANHLVPLNQTLTPAQTYASGDIDGDLDVDVADFRLFKNDYIAANGAAAWAALGAAVPEPCALSLLIVGGALAAIGRRPKRATPC